MEDKIIHYAKIIAFRLEALNNRFQLYRELQTNENLRQIESHFINYVSVSFRKEMILLVCHLIEPRSINHENITLERLLDLYMKTIENSNKNLITKCNLEIRKVIKYRKDKPDILKLRNKIVAHSEYKIINEGLQVNITQDDLWKGYELGCDIVNFVLKNCSGINLKIRNEPNEDAIGDLKVMAQSLVEQRTFIEILKNERSNNKVSVFEKYH